MWKKTDEERPPHGRHVLIVGEDGKTMWMGTYLEKWGELHGDGDDSVDIAWLDHDEDEDEYYFPAGWYGLGPYDGHANGWYQRVDLKAAWWRELPELPSATEAIDLRYELAEKTESLERVGSFLRRFAFDLDEEIESLKGLGLSLDLED